MILYCEQTGAACTDAEIVAEWLRTGSFSRVDLGKAEGKLPSNAIMMIYSTWPNPPRPRYMVYCSGCEQEMLMYDCDLILGRFTCRPCRGQPDHTRSLHNAAWLALQDAGLVSMTDFAEARK